MTTRSHPWLVFSPSASLSHLLHMRGGASTTWTSSPPSSMMITRKRYKCGSPPEFVVSRQEGKVFQWRKELYELRQSPWA
jgi:hypothetical protein